ncbi:MAG TPA: PQQ-binding-like beta-propeller repeat protein [Candidatus Dormibacteraeota bacterium]|nr:PQQ-binding-like beta-propeller repeat protein [Candidatus Dormibacteraeota bacterium]
MKARALLASLLLLAPFTFGLPLAGSAPTAFATQSAAVGESPAAGMTSTTAATNHAGLVVAGARLAPRAALLTPITPNGSWPVYHHDDAHSGADPAAKYVTSVIPGWTSAATDKQIYAEPLIYGGIVYAATLNNTVYAFNQTDGSLVWSKNMEADFGLGNPESRCCGGANAWGCGNVSPQGILGTPVIDPSTNRIYAAILLTDPLGGSADQYRLVGLNLATGALELNTLISATGFDWRIQQERGALAVHSGYVYVPFGGRAGDCGNYSGWVFGVPTNGSTTLTVGQTSNTGNGIWAAGGVAVDDTTGDVYVTTGNGVNNGSGDGCSDDGLGNPNFINDAVVQSSSSLVENTYFMPGDWQANWCSNDQDLGSAGPLLISHSLMFQAGKWGTGFLLDPTNLGGVGGQLFPTPAGSDSGNDVCFGNHSDATFGSFAYSAPFVYVECEGHGLVALHVDTVTPSFSPCDSVCAAPDWHAGGTTTFGPPIVAAGAVWVASNGGGLFAYRAGTGALIYHSAGFSINRFSTPAEAGGQVFVAAGNVVKQFVMHFGATQSTAPPSVPPRTPVVQVSPAAPVTRPPVNQSSPSPPPPR